MSKSSLTVWLEAVVVAAMAMALSYVPDLASWFTPSFGVVPVALFALRRGAVFGMVAGLLWALLHFPLGKVYMTSLIQVILEYPIAFTLVGLAGVFSTAFQYTLAQQAKKTAITVGVIAVAIGVLARYVCHYIAGVLFFYMYAPEGQSAEFYSLSVNGTAGVLTFVIATIVLVATINRVPKVLLARA